MCKFSIRRKKLKLSSAIWRPFCSASMCFKLQGPSPLVVKEWCTANLKLLGTQMVLISHMKWDMPDLSGKTTFQEMFGRWCQTWRKMFSFSCKQWFTFTHVSNDKGNISEFLLKFGFDWFSLDVVWRVAIGLVTYLPVQKTKRSKIMELNNSIYKALIILNYANVFELWGSIKLTHRILCLAILIRLAWFLNPPRVHYGIELYDLLRRVLWGLILHGCHHRTRLRNSLDVKWLWRDMQSEWLSGT